MSKLLKGFRDLRIKYKLIVLFIIVGFAPLSLFGLISWYRANLSLNEAGADAAHALKAQIGFQLVALRENKRIQVENYFNFINGQMHTMAENAMVVDAAVRFNRAFPKYINDADISNAKIEEARSDLRTFYQGTFAENYRRQTGRDVDVDSLFKGLGETTIALQDAYVHDNPNPLGSKHLMTRAEADATYNDIHEAFHPVIRRFIEEFAYYDFFLVKADSGDVMYSVFKELDFATSLVDGPFAGSNLGEAYRRALELNKGETVLMDYQPYTPSYEAPASFIASPVFDGSKKVAVLIFQMPLDRLSGIMNVRAGLGETGETILVGPDNFLRSDSYKDPKNYSVVVSFQKGNKADCESAKTVFKEGKSGVYESVDYLGEKVITSYGPVAVGNLTWALIAKIDTEEAFAPIFALEDQSEDHKRKLMLSAAGVFLVAGIIIIAFGLLAAPAISVPLTQLMSFAKTAAQGDLTHQVSVDRGDEMGGLAKEINTMMANLKETITMVVRGSDTVNGQTTELSGTATDLNGLSEKCLDRVGRVSLQIEEMAETFKKLSVSARGAFQNVDGVAQNLGQITGDVDRVAGGAEEMNNHLQEISAAMEEFHATTNEISNLCMESASLSGAGREQAAEAKTQIRTLNEEAKNIAKVLELIEHITAQTNLLSLNASIEAASAGDAGRGFTIVAEEIKELAKKTGEATQGIIERITAIQDETRNVETRIDNVADSIGRIDEMATSIASAVEEQSATIGEIAQSLGQASTEAGNIAARVRSISDGVGNINQHSTSVAGLVKGIAEGCETVTETASHASRDVVEVKSFAGLVTDASNALNVSVSGMTALTDELRCATQKFQLA